MVLIHSLDKFLKEFRIFPLHIYSLVFLRLEFSPRFWKSEAILPTDALQVLAHMSLWVQFAVFLDVWGIWRHYAGGGGKIWITSWGMRRINPCESRRLLLKSLHNEVFHVFTATVNSRLTSFILHCLSNYIYIDDTLYKQFTEVYSWFISIFKTFLRWTVSITCFVSTSQIYL